ncbi:MAG: ester cyclase [Chloroflexi bacterium]|nr:MAG: ester cyclase [Chloroflexota bacterium]
MANCPPAKLTSSICKWARSDFPDMRIQVEDLVAEAAKVIVRFTAHGTHSS